MRVDLREVRDDDVDALFEFAACRGQQIEETIMRRDA